MQCASLNNVFTLLSDPEKWDRSDVMRCVRWVARTFRVAAPRRHLLPDTGKDLLALTAQQWTEVIKQLYICVQGSGSHLPEAVSEIVELFTICLDIGIKYWHLNYIKIKGERCFRGLGTVTSAPRR